MASIPRPDLVTWVCVGLLAIPTFAVLILSVVAIILTATGALGGPSVLLAIFAPLVCPPLLVAEYYAIARGSHNATSTIACLGLYVAVLGSIGWVGGLLDVLSLKATGRNPMSLGDLIANSIFLADPVVVGFGHLRWLRILKASSSQ